jgi:putative MATE family efflux protein
LPTGIQQTFVALGGLALMGIVNTFGTNVIAGFSVANRVDTLATIPAMSFSQALSTFVGQNIGANKLDRIRTGLRSTIKMSGAITIATTIIIVIWGHIIMSLFTKDSQVIRIGDQYLTIVSIFYILFTMMFIYTGIMRGAGDTLIPMFFSLISLWLIRIPLAYFLSKRIGSEGIWWAIPAGWFIGLSLAFLYYKTGRWKTKTVVKFDENL